MKHTITESLGLNIVGNIWYNVGAQVDNIYKKGRVIYQHLDKEMLHIASLSDVISPEKNFST